MIKARAGRRTKADGSQYEDDLQAACVKWFRLAYPRVIGYHVPNGGNRDAREAARLKGLGVMAGIPDWCIDDPRGGYHGARIELKTGKNGLTDEQASILARYAELGYFAGVAWNFDEFKKMVDSYMAAQETRCMHADQN